MDSNTYFSLLQYLTDFTFPTNLPNDQQAAVKRKAQFFVIIDGCLYKKNKDNPQ